MWSLFKISRAGEGHIVIGGVSVYAMLGLYSLLQFSQAAMIQTSSNKEPHISKNEVFLSPWILQQPTTRNNIEKHFKQQFTIAADQGIASFIHLVR